MFDTLVHQIDTVTDLDGEGSTTLSSEGSTTLSSGDSAESSSGEEDMESRVSAAPELSEIQKTASVAAWLV